MIQQQQQQQQLMVVVLDLIAAGLGGGATVGRQRVQDTCQMLCNYTQCIQDFVQQSVHFKLRTYTVN